MTCFSPHPQEDVSRHEGEDRGTRPASTVLHRHGHRARGQQEIQVAEVGQSFNLTVYVVEMTRQVGLNY